MAETKHTPGPWINHPNESCVGYAARITDGGGKCIAEIPFKNGKGFANARLFAAAPDMLNACRIALKTLEMCRDDLAAAGDCGNENELCAEAKALTPAIQKLRAAIAKADGK